MSITATIDEPRNELEENFNITICSNSTYKKVIWAVANYHNLSAFNCWGALTEIDNDAFVIFNEQLSVMKEEVIKLTEIPDATKTQVLERLDILQRSMAELFEKNRDIVILIG